MSEKRRQLVIVLCIYLLWVALATAGNVLFAIGERNGTPKLTGAVGGILMILDSLIVQIIVPLWLARRWGLEYAFWPRGKNWLMGAVLVALYTFMFIGGSFPQLSSIPTDEFIAHYVSSMNPHVTYYLLFAVLMLPVFRKNFGMKMSLVLTAALFALYHLSQFFIFPVGMGFLVLIQLFATFLGFLLLYLWTESAILVGLGHSIAGSVGLAVGGTVFGEFDGRFYSTIVIMLGVFAYMIVYELRHSDRLYDKGWWLKVEIDA